MAMQPPLDTDTYWHLAAGEWQVQNRAVLMQDVFSSTRFSEPWVNHSWLSQYLIYGAYAAAGDLGLALFTAVIAVVGMAFVWAQCEADPIIAALTVVLASASAAIFWSARPQMLSFLFSSIVLYLLWLYEVRQIDRLWLVPLLMMIWANVHAGFAIGFVLLVLFTIGTGLNWLISGLDVEEPLTFRRVLRPVVIGLVSAFAVSLNPYGPRMLLYPFQTVSIEALQQFIQEWAVPNFRSPQVWPFVWLLLGTFAVSSLSSARTRLTNLVMLVGTAYLALMSARNIAVFSIVAAPILARHAQILLQDLHLTLKTNRLPGRGGFAVLNIVLIALAIMGAGAKTIYEMQPERLAQLRASRLPISAVEHLSGDDVQGAMFNSYNWGGYLIWALDDLPVFVDGRTDLYGDEILSPYLTMYLNDGDSMALLDQYTINTIVVETFSPIGVDLASNEDWMVVYDDDLAVVLERKVPR